MRKILETHTPIHIHHNNHRVPLLIQPDNFFNIGEVFEVTYVRSRDFRFTNDNSFYPTHLDSPNNLDWPETPIGYFDLILEQ